MSLSAKIREQLINSFRAELSEHVQTITDGLLAVEQRKITGQERRSTLEEIFRAAHSLKGAARAVGVTTIEQLAHALESVLDALQHDAIRPTQDLFNACYHALDAIQAVQAAYEAGETTPPAQALQALAGLGPFLPQAAPARAPGHVEDEATATAAAVDLSQDVAGVVPVVGETIRVNVDKLDALMGQLGEILITKIRAEQHLTQMRQLQGVVAQWQREWRAVRGSYRQLIRQRDEGHDGDHGSGRDSSRDSSRHSLSKNVIRLLDYAGYNQGRLHDLGIQINSMTRQYANDMTHMSLVIDELEEEIKRVRMLPLSTITAPFGRMVRDLAHSAGKEAVLHIVGGDTELDKQVLEQIKDPLVHLLRNAVDHGIEPPERREALNKPRSGNITLTAEQLGNDVVICVSEDGAGLNIAAIRQAVARHDKVDTQAMTEAELVEAIFRTGISTNPIITDVSGRGIGLDVVRRNVEALQGRVSVDWAPDAGTTFTLTLPLTLTSSRGLLVRASGELFAIPLNHVERLSFISTADITSIEGCEAVRYDGRPLPLVWLSDVLELPRADVQHDEARIPVVILSALDRKMAFVVDGLAGEQGVVIKGLGRQLVRVGGITGATIMGNGQVVLILNVADLIKLGLREGRQSVRSAFEEQTSPEQARARQHILIVDDSITTRTLEKNILQAIGYSVEVATDGQEALNVIAASGVPDLIISDIMMPRVDGFELTQRIKSDPKTAHVPVILVTSLGSSEDKTRGIEAGADAYIVKSAFDQSNLLETIEQLI